MSSYTCSTCGREFSHCALLRNHIKVHDNAVVDKALQKISEEEEQACEQLEEEEELSYDEQLEEEEELSYNKQLEEEGKEELSYDEQLKEEEEFNYEKSLEEEEEDQYLPENAA
ncbi:7201_t:CDS:2, partial [Funneliformis geosporum]